MNNISQNIFILKTTAHNRQEEYRVAILPSDFSEKEDNPNSTKTFTDAFKLCNAFGASVRYNTLPLAMQEAMQYIREGMEIKVLEIPISYDTFLNQYCESYWKNHRKSVSENPPIAGRDILAHDSDTLQDYIHLKEIRRKQTQETHQRERERREREENKNRKPFKQRGNAIFELLLFILIIFLISTLFGMYKCSSKAKVMGFNSKYGPVIGCMIEYQPKKWISMDKYRSTDVE